MESENCNPYAPGLSCQYAPRGILGHYLERVANEFSLWLFGTLAACAPWLVLRTHYFLRLEMQRIDESLALGLALIILVWWTIEYSYGARMASRVVLHYLVSICIFSVATVCFVSFFWLAY